MSDLKHYGIQGQKWGIRRFQRKDGTRTPAGKKREVNQASDDYTTSRTLKAKGLKSLSTNELKTVTTRMQLEQQYKQLNKQSSGFKKADNFIKGLLAAGTTISSLYALSQTPLGKQVTSLIKKKTGG